MEGDDPPVAAREPITPPLTTDQKTAALALSKTSVADITREIQDSQERATQEFNKAGVRAIKSAMGQVAKQDIPKVDLFANLRRRSQEPQQQSTQCRIISRVLNLSSRPVNTILTSIEPFTTSTTDLSPRD